MTRKDIQEKYNFIGDNNDISLYRKKGEFSYGMGYCGNIALKNGHAVFNGKTYKDIESLDNALVEWEKSLKFPVDTYNPMTREAYRVECRLVWYLTEKMGFKSYYSDWDHYYAKNIGPNFQMRFYIKVIELEKVQIQTSFSNMSFIQEVVDAEDGIAIIDSIVKGTVLMMAKDVVDIMAACGNEVTTEIDAYVPANNIFGQKKVSFKDLMIEKLEETLKQLKES